jgi:hypothetical protein
MADTRLADFTTLLLSSGLPVALNHFDTPQKLPYLIYVLLPHNMEAADGINYFDSLNIQIELYTTIKDPAKESAVEKLLTDAGYFFTKDEGYLSDEKMYMVTYQISI